MHTQETQETCTTISACLHEEQESKLMQALEASTMRKVQATDDHKNSEQKEPTKFIENQQNPTTSKEFFDESREIIETSTKTSLNGDEETIFIPDIDEGSPRPEPNKSANQIFFTETTNIDGGPLILNAREACAVESAAIFHPNRTIFVIFTGPTYKNNSELIKILQENYPNIHFRSAIFENITNGSPLEGFTKFRESTFLSVHVSDALRLVLLWKYGGLFLDLDIVVLKPFDALNENFVCRAANNRLQSGTLDFSGKGIGKKVSQMCLEHLRDNFDPKLWNSNGPDLIMAVMKRICKVKIPDMNEKRCQGMKVLAKNDFLPLGEAKQYIDQGKNRSYPEKSEN
ncbi:alpha-1,4-N-acetylglucosaminyltransferase-like [Culicoides brevitarsis]|uniref:alpha-1,4-N-acetylglucosaminyltransferase-like n=1 Tax=Culicoides brevitarsis TaxID=469753 RepID=UPI00307C2E56